MHLFLALMIVIVSFSGNSSATNVSPVITSALEFGGDKLVDFTYTDGSKTNIEAGRGIVIGGGVNIDLTETSPHTFEAQLTLALKWTSTKEAKNGEVDWYRFPIELISFYRRSEMNLRVGAGVSYQFANELRGSKEVSQASEKFENATGFIFESDYLVGDRKNLGIGFRYTAIDYRARAPGSTFVNGNSFGVSISYFFL